jgi:Domain of unknown function DUF11
MRTKPLLVAAAVVAAFCTTATPALADEPVLVTGVVSPAEVQPGDTFTVTETVHNGQFPSILGPAIRVTGSPESLTSFADLVSCSGDAATCVTVDGPDGPVGYRAILPEAMGAFETRTIVFTLRVKPDAEGAVHTLMGNVLGRNYETAPVTLGTLTVISQADVAVGVTATPRFGLLVPRIDMTVKVTNNGPGKVRSAQVRGSLAAGLTSSAGTRCTGGAQPVCTFGELAAGASTTGTFSVPIGLLYIGLPYQFSVTRTASSPTDPDTANNTAATSCRVLTLLLVSCG